jgi:toxin ParE1/3/4
VRVIWTYRAIRHLTNLRSYIERGKTQAARPVAERIVAASESLAAHPEMGRPGRKSGTRELIIPNTPYVIPYNVKGKIVIILAVFHGAQLK